jgi:prepilin-type N-terminal cleavage/methylation domain-containing protein
MKINVKKRAFSLMELAVGIGVVGILAGVAAIPLTRYIEDGRGNACTQQLAEVHRATITYISINNISQADYSSAVTGDAIKVYLGGKVINTDFNCPIDGTYTLGTWSASESGPQPPTCSCSKKDATARLHSLGN